MTYMSPAKSLGYMANKLLESNLPCGIQKLEPIIVYNC